MSLLPLNLEMEEEHSGNEVVRRTCLKARGFQYLIFKEGKRHVTWAPIPAWTPAPETAVKIANCT